MILLPFIAAWEQHTPESRELADDIVAAFRAADLPQKAAAILMGVNDAQLSRQLAGVEPLNLWRLTALPKTFWLALFSCRLARVGGAVLTPTQLAMLQGAATIGPRMLAVVLKPSTDERKHA